MKRIQMGVVAAALQVFPALAGQRYTWQGPSATDRSGAWETAANWVVSGATATTYPGESATDDQAYFTNGNYTVTLASDKTLSILERTKTNEGGAAADQGTCTIDLSGYRLTASQRIDCSIRTYQFQGGIAGVGSTLVFTNGTVACDAAVSTVAGGTDAAYANATGVGIGLPWGNWQERIRGILAFRSVVADFAALEVQSTQGGVRIEDGATVAVSGRFAVGGTDDAAKLNGLDLLVSGVGTTFSAGNMYLSGQNGFTNLFENGALANVGYLCQAVSQKKNQTKESGDIGAYTVIRSGATLNVTSVYSTVNGAAIYCHQSQVRPQHIVVTGAGSQLKLTYSGSKGHPNIGVGNIGSSPQCHTLEAYDGAVVTGDANSLVSIGSDTGDKMVILDDATISLGYLMSGTTYWCSEGGISKLGLASNNTIRVSGRRAKLECKGSEAYSNAQSGGAGAMNFNFNTSLEITVPQTGFAEAPIQVPNHRLCSKGSTINAYVGTPGCHLTIRAKDWAKRNKGSKQTLIATGLDSTAAFTELTNNVVFADITDESLRPTLRIDKDGTATSLVLVAPPPRGLMVLLR